MNNVSEIAKLNDEFRANPSLGTLILTEGIRSNTHDDITTIISKVRNFNDFDENNNPYGERDFGAITNMAVIQFQQYSSQSFIYNL